MLHSWQQVLQGVLGSPEPGLLLGFSYSGLILDPVNHGAESKVKPVHVCWKSKKRPGGGEREKHRRSMAAARTRRSRRSRDLHGGSQAAFAGVTWRHRFLQLQLELDALCQAVDQSQGIDLALPVPLNQNVGVRGGLDVPT